MSIASRSKNALVWAEKGKKSNRWYDGGIILLGLFRMHWSSWKLGSSHGIDQGTDIMSEVNRLKNSPSAKFSGQQFQLQDNDCFISSVDETIAQWTSLNCSRDLFESITSILASSSCDFTFDIKHPDTTFNKHYSIPTYIRVCSAGLWIINPNRYLLLSSPSKRWTTEMIQNSSHVRETFASLCCKVISKQS